MFSALQLSSFLSWYYTFFSFSSLLSFSFFPFFAFLLLSSLLFSSLLFYSLFFSSLLFSSHFSPSLLLSAFLITLPLNSLYILIYFVKVCPLPSLLPPSPSAAHGLSNASSWGIGSIGIGERHHHIFIHFSHYNLQASEPPKGWPHR